MVQSNVHIHASDMGAAVMRQQDFRYPAAYEHDILFVFAQKMDELYKHRTGCLDSFGRIIPAGYHVTLSLLTNSV